MNKAIFSIRHLMSIILLLVLALPLCAQEKTDSMFSFRFFAGKNMFYVPFINNGRQLDSLLNCVGQYKDLIKKHEIWVMVNGYCNSKGSKAANLAMAKIRSNRVKSELITRKGLTEDCFITKNHSGDGDFVEVNLFVPKKFVVEEPKQDEKKDTAEIKAAEDAVPEVPEVIENPEPIDTVKDISPEPAVAQPDTISIAKDKIERFALKTNLLDYAILMPNLEVEWMFTDRWSVALEVQSAWYSKTPPHKVYRLATMMPEVRFWTINRAKWHGMYVGIFGGAGMYDLSNGKRKGHRGEGYFGGVSAGYMWPISKHLSLDAGLGVGYLWIHDKVYTPRDGHYLYQMTKNINYFGPLRLKLSLVWRIPMNK